MVETRAEATARVTEAVIAWLWGRGCRLLAQEVGIRIPGRLCVPWSSHYRADVVGVIGRQTHLLEVKGTRADLGREILGRGKWVMTYPGICRWLAIDSRIQNPETLHRDWGILVVDDKKTTIVREPAMVEDDDILGSTTALAKILCFQSLPTMIGRTREERLAALRAAGVERPWRYWTDDEVRRTSDPFSVDGSGDDGP